MNRADCSCMRCRMARGDSPPATDLPFAWCLLWAVVGAGLWLGLFVALRALVDWVR